MTNPVPPSAYTTSSGSAGSSGTSFNPSQSYGTSSTSSNSTIVLLPDGSYDLYNLGAIASQSIFTGNSVTPLGPGAFGPHGEATETGVTTTTSPQYAKAYQVLENYAKMSAEDPGQFAQIQSELYNAGFYSSTAQPNFGAWTAKDGDAMSEALRGYLGVEQTGVPMTFEEYLSKTGSAGEQQTPPIALTDTATLESKANAAGQNDLGRNLNGAEQAAFVSKFHNEEINAAQQKADAKTTTGIGTYEGPSRYDAQNSADQMIQTTDNAEYQGHLQASYMDRMLQMFGVSSGG